MSPSAPISEEKKIFDIERLKIKQCERCNIIPFVIKTQMWHYREIKQRRKLPVPREGKATHKMFIENRVRGNARNKILYTLIFRRTMSRGVCEIMYLARWRNLQLAERCEKCTACSKWVNKTGVAQHLTLF